MTTEEIQKLQAENKRLKALVEQDSKAKNLEFAESLISEGKLAPIAKQKAIEILNYALDYDNGETLDFAENENLSQKVKDFLNCLPKMNLIGEIATKERAAEQDFAPVVEYSENTPFEMVELDKKIRSYAVVHGLSYTDAFNIIVKKGE